MPTSLRSVFRRATEKMLAKTVTRRPAPRLETLEPRETPTGVYSGTVFQDFDADGTRDTTSTVTNTSGTGSVALAVDRGIGGITVTAYNAAGGVAGTTTTSTVAATLGAFSFTPAGTGPYRFEFTNLPTGFQAGPQGTDSGTLVQFRNDGGSNTLSAGIVRPEDYVQTNPLILNAVLNFGAFNGPHAASTALLGVPYAAGGTTGGFTNPTTYAINIPHSRIGSVYSVAYDPFARDVYASAYFKRHSGFGPGGTGAVYRFNYPAGAATNFQPPAGSLVWVDLNALFGANTAGANLHDNTDDNANGLADDYDTDNGNTGWDAVGKTGLGGMDTSDDGQFVFVMNLADRQLYRIRSVANPTVADIQRVSIPLTNPDATGTIITAARFRAADLRPFAVQYHQGRVYVGVTYTAETLATGPDDATARAEMMAAVYELDPATMTFVGSPVFTARLNYPRSQSTTAFAGADPNVSPWRPWRPTYFSTSPNTNFGVAPQALFTDIAFDASGNMTLGLRDRGADQIGFYALSNAAAPGNRIEGFTTGDMLQAFINTPNNLSSGWVLESNSRNPLDATQGAGPQNNNAGPGNGEFFHQENFNNNGGHGETSMGGLLQLPGHPDILSVQMDPAIDARAGGWSWYNRLTGNEVKAYQIYGNGGNPTGPGNIPATFSKANGLGGLTVIRDLAPIEVGNRVWLDADGDGIQDPNELPAVGVTVRLYDALNNLLGTAVTDAQGRYFFSNRAATSTASAIYGIAGLVRNGTFTVRMDNPLNYAAGGPLAGLRPTRRDADATPNGDARDSDAQLVAGFARITLTTGAPGFNDHTSDAGFTPPLSLGNRVFDDRDNTGSFTTGDAGIDGVAVDLFFDANNDGVITGAETTAVASTTTAGGGLYLFTELVSGNYVVELAASNFTGAGVLVGYTSSTGTFGSATGPSETAPDADTVATDGDDNGTVAGALGAGGVIRSQPVTLAAGTEPTGENPNNDPGSTDNNSNLTVDFGVFLPFSLGNRVWLDLDNSGTLNGAETGINGVTVALFADANADGTPDGAALVTTTTAGGGYYRFDRLVGGLYLVFVTQGAGTPLAGLASSTPSEPDPNTNVDNDNNGIVVSATQVRSGTVSLGPTAIEPTNESDLSISDPGAPNNQSNLSIDFGFTPLYSLGNRVWLDTDNSGTINGTEGGVNGVTVNLYADTNNDNVPDGAAVATTATVGGGYYRFDGLLAGNYIVEVVTTAAGLANTVSSTPNAGDPDTDADDSDDNGVVVAATTVRSNAVTLGPTPNEPTGETDLSGGQGNADNQANMTVDFGFTPLFSLGNRVWRDTDNSGTINGTEGGIDGVSVRLYRDTNDDGIADGAALFTVVTAGGGYYRFDGLTADTYIVEVDTTTLPAGLSSSTVNGGDPDTNAADSDDNGVVVGAGFVRSNPVTLGGATPEPTGETDLGPGGQGSADNQSNLTVDFGFSSVLALGNQVFEDINNDGVRNGTEAGIDGVAVELFFDANGDNALTGAELTPIASTTTAGGGLYLFANLQPGSYVVQLPGSNFDGGPLAGFRSSTGLGTNPFEPAADPDNDTDTNDDGTESGGVITSGFVTLSVGGEPAGETPNNAPGVADANANLTVDFGVFLPYSLGNRVWNDANTDGLRDDTEAGLANVTVRLFRDSNNDGTPDGPAVATTTTDPDGYYRFDLLGADTYIVEIDGNSLPAGFFTAPLTGGDPDNDTDDDNNVATAQAVPGVITYRSNPVTLGGATPEPVGEDDLGPGGQGTVDNRSNLTVDFGFTDAIYSVGGNIYYDADNDGVIDGAGEPLITQTTTITLTGTDYLGNPVNLTQVTTTGTYNFTNVRPSNAGGYTLTQTVQPAGYLDGRETAGTPFATGTVPVAGETIPAVVIPVGSAQTTGVNYNFGELLPASIGNFVWFDQNGNGRQDGTEPGIEGISVTLSGTTDRGVITPVTIQTAAAGAYLFGNLRPGTYTVTFGTITATTTYVRTVRDSAVATDATDSDANPTTGIAPAVTLVAGQNDPTIDSGLTLLASVGDTVWFDIDNNGTQNGTEPGIGGVTVTLNYAGLDGVFSTADDQLGVATQVTTAAGEYLFTGLQPGVYSTTVTPATLPAGLTTQTFDLDGTGTANTAEFTLAAGDDLRTVDYGYTGTASLGDTVWYDIDRSGTQNNGEPGISGVSVGLVWAGANGTFGDADDVTFAPQVTSATGFYQFTNLPAGNFRTTADAASLPAGVTVNTYDLDSGTTNPNGTADATLAAGQDREDVDFGYTGSGLIGDRVWLDANGNGAQDNGEPGIVGVTVTLTWFGPDGQPGGGNDVTLTTTTAANGFYLFSTLPPGAYQVVVTPPAGITQTGDPDATLDNTSQVTLAAGGSNLVQDFGYQGGSSVAGNVYVDLDNDGVFDATETPIPGTTVTLTGTDSLGNPVNLTTTTLADGSYIFAGLVPGTYTLTETQPAAWGDGKDTVGTLNGTTGNDVFSNIVVGANQTGTGYNFGETPGTISGVVFHDQDQDGTLDSGEPPIPGTTVTLTNAAGTVVATTQALADGSYTFTNLPAGVYTVTETQPTGYGNPPTGPFAPDTRQVTLPPGGTVANQNFGDTLGSIAGSVYVDLNDNGVLDAGEPGIGGVTVTLTDGEIVRTTTTAADGSYLFTNLPAATYSLIETQPANFTDGKDKAGTSGGSVTAPDSIVAVTLAGGVNATGYTFGELGAGVSGVSYFDANQDGKYTPGTDTPLAGVTVTLTGPGVNLTVVTGADGTYSFVGIPAGVYTLTETQPTGYGNGETPTNVRQVTVPPNTVVANQNFGNTLGSIAGVVYVDYNLNGVRDAAGTNPEVGIPNVTVTLLDANGAVVAVQQTGADGSYFFGNLGLGTYTIRETQPPLPDGKGNGYYDGADNLGSLGGTRPVKNTQTATIGADATGNAQNGVQYNFGELPPADPFGFVYEDINRNGVMDAGEPGIPGVTITFTGTPFAGTPFEQAPITLTTTTDANGRWEFNPVPPGLYSITEAQPAGFLDGQEQNGDPNPPATVVVGNDVFTNVVLNPFPIRGPFNFGEFRPVAPPAVLPPFDFFPPVVTTTDISKRQFLSTVDPTTGGTTVLAGPTSPAFASFGPSANRPPVYASIAQAAGNGWVRVFDFATGAERFRFQPYGDFTGGVRVATADVTGDGIPDVITAPGVSGGPVVKVFDGNTGALVRSILAFEPDFRGGLQVAATDLNGDFMADLIVTPDEGGGPVVRVFDGATGGVLTNFFALDETFRGGLRIATGDVDNDGVGDLLVTAGVGGGPRVAGYDGALLLTSHGKLFNDFFAFAPELRDGFWVTAGDTNGDGFADVVVGAGTGGAPRVGVYSGALLVGGTGFNPVNSFFAGDESLRSGVRVKAVDLDNDGRAEVIAAPESGALPTVGIYNPLTGARRDAFYGFPTNDLAGVYVG